jgi:hypothetical protein
MNQIKNIKCWEIMKCDNQDCPARHEPETPCWEIAKRVGSYKNISNTCRDCVVYILKEEIDVISPKEIKKIITQREFSREMECALLDCFLSSKKNK